MKNLNVYQIYGYPANPVQSTMEKTRWKKLENYIHWLHIKEFLTILLTDKWERNNLIFSLQLFIKNYNIKAYEMLSIPCYWGIRDM